MGLAPSHKPGAKWARRGERWQRRRRQEVNEPLNGFIVFWSTERVFTAGEKEKRERENLEGEE